MINQDEVEGRLDHLIKKRQSCTTSGYGGCIGGRGFRTITIRGDPDFSGMGDRASVLNGFGSGGRFNGSNSGFNNGAYTSGPPTILYDGDCDCFRFFNCGK